MSASAAAIGAVALCTGSAMKGSGRPPSASRTRSVAT
jgi:hypothetical protein